MKTEILAWLRGHEGEYVSGQELCEHFGVTRTAVWKAVSRLRQEGYVIEAVPNRGYRLLDTEDVFCAEEIRAKLHTSWAGRNLSFFAEIDSSNLQAKREAELSAPHGTLVVADAQTAGRGRRGRQWESPSGRNLYFTLLLRPDIPPQKASMLTLVMAHAVARGIYDETGYTCGIKWPNDIVAEKKKVCGILTELSTEVEQIHYVLIGVGINVGAQKFPDALRETATTLCEVCGRKVSRAGLLSRIMEEFEKDYEQFVSDQDLRSLLSDYNSMLVNRDTEVRVLDPKGEYTGIARGADSTGALLVETDKGLQSVTSGEVSVRGIYGYV